MSHVEDAESPEISSKVESTESAETASKIEETANTTSEISEKKITEDEKC